MLQLDQTVTKADFSFTTIEGGGYLWQIVEGIELKEKDNTRTGNKDRSYWFPVQVCGVIPGESKDMNAVATQAKGILFINPATASGAKQFNALLNATGLMISLMQTFGQQIDEYSPSVQAFLKQNLVGKVVKLTHELKVKVDPTTKQENKNMNFLNIESAYPSTGAGIPNTGVAAGVPGMPPMPGVAPTIPGVIPGMPGGAKGF